MSESSATRTMQHLACLDYGVFGHRFHSHWVCHERFLSWLLPKRKLRTISITQLSALGQSRPFCEEALSGKLTQHSSAVLAVADSFLRLRLLAHTCDSEERNSFGLSPTSVTVLFSSSHRLQLLHRVIRTEVEKSYSNAGLCWSACVRRWWVIKLSPVWPWCVTALRIFITIPID